jgi:hypothetical protein
MIRKLSLIWNRQKPLLFPLSSLSGVERGGFSLNFTELRKVLESKRVLSDKVVSVMVSIGPP